MRHVFRTVIFSLIVLLICAVAIYPPSAKLRKGRDLAGGATLVYQVELKPNDPTSLIDQVIGVLRDRVDPNGVMEIAFNRQGRDRIEVSMPLPTEQVQKLKKEYQDTLDNVASLAIDGPELDRVLRMPPEERNKEIARLAAGNDARLATLTKAAEAYDAMKQARAAYDEAVASKAPQDQLDGFLAKAGDAAIALDSARKAALAMSVTAGELETALQLSNDERRITDTETNKLVTLPSPRAIALKRIKEAHPEAVAQVDQVVAAYDRFVSKRTGLDDPQDLKRLLRGAGVLNFRIAVRPGALPDEARLRRELQQNGPRGVQSTDARWFPIQNIDTWFDSKQQYDFLQAEPQRYFHQRQLVGDERDGVYYLLLYDRPGSRMTETAGKWSVSNAYKGIDPLGRPAINFEMDPLGARLLGQLTEKNIGEPMAVLLDDKVYTAPTLQSAISSNGQITGNFPPFEISYLVKTLQAGSLQARLRPDPISEDVLGPELGADNLRHGLHAGLIAFIIVAAFMTVYYFSAGLISVIALLCNSIVILGLMSLNRAAFTLPGIAGVILTFGMAVDSNVLIYERIREELEKGLDLKAAVRLGFDRVFSTIIDANVTTLIACVVLYYTATQELKGFAITMGIGIVGTLFSALLVTRVIFTILVDYIGVQRMRQLPMMIPALQKLLTPHVNWLRLRPLFWIVSGGFSIFAIAMVVINGKSMLDNEFRGGTSVTVPLTQTSGPDAGKPLFKTRLDVEQRIRALQVGAAPKSDTYEIAFSEIVPVNPQADGVTSDHFRIKTTVTDQAAVQDAVIHALSDWIETKPPLHFDGVGADSVANAPVFRILEPVLGADIGRPEIRNDVSKYMGGAAIVLDNFTDPMPTKQSIEARIDQMRESPSFADIAGWPSEVIVIEDGPGGKVRSAVVVMVDDQVTVFADEAVWKADVAARAWSLVREAMSTSTSLASVQSFSAQIAETFKAQATVAVVLTLLAIIIYIWIRFGSVRYSIAAVVSLLHDIFATLGFIALANIVYVRFPHLAAALLIEPFKIDLGLVAALLTIVGYSLNDTIVVMDRVRENRGKLGYASADVINASINQTMSRTVITTGTTLLAIFILYIDGGSGAHSFAYALLVGVFSGSYSTVAIASPLLYSRRHDAAGGRKALAKPGVDSKEALAVA